MSQPPVALVVGTGLIGGSVALGLKAQGFTVHGIDADAERLSSALAAGVIDHVGDTLAASLVVVATPATAATTVVGEILGTPGRPAELLVTDVCGVKAPLEALMDDPRFIGGHPMAGSEQVGLAGARADLFVGASWVLTPIATTDSVRFARLAGICQGFGAQVVALSPQDHDRLVAIVSHVPHLLAATLMHRAVSGAESDGALLQLAAGGFRDMTRVAAGDPAIWPGLCLANREAIMATIDQVEEDLTVIRSALAVGDGAQLEAFLTTAAAARRALPARLPVPAALVELRVPISDRPGSLAEVATTASDLGVNVVDLQIAHSIEGGAGVLQLTVDAASVERLEAALQARGYRTNVAELG